MNPDENSIENQSVATGTPLQAKLTCAEVGLFLLAVAVLTGVIALGQYVAWISEQLAITAVNPSSANWAGETWFIVQALGVIVVAFLCMFFTHNTLRGIYRGWLVAALVGMPALGLRFIDTNLDQVGSLAQIALMLPAAVGIIFLRRKTLNFGFRAVLKALAVIPWIVWPFVLIGATGSSGDILLNLLAGLALGLLAASLAASCRNFWLDGLGLSILLLILGTSFGYDGSQLLLMTVLPSIGFIGAGWMPSLPALALGVGLVAATPLIFIDPTEMALILGDLSPWTSLASWGTLGLALVAGVLWGLLRLWKSRPSSLASQLLLLVLGWGSILMLYLLAGQPGFYGDRLFVILADQADVSAAVKMTDRDQRLITVYETLTAHAETTQASLRQRLDIFGINYKPYYLVNAVEVDGGLLTRLLLTFSPEVDRVLASPRLRPLPLTGQMITGYAPAPSGEVGWNIQMIGAEQVWREFGVTGEGIVIGQSDSGVDATHPALQATYRGATGGNDYNWLDPWGYSAIPHDLIGHGTHTLGTILGQGGIGVAPGAQWFACLNLERNLGNPAFYLDCMQFMLAPFPQSGDPFVDGDPTRAAHVLNNSWGCPPLEGCDPNTFEAAVGALRAAGIFMVVSNGNDGPDCETTVYPPALYDSVFSVGAIDLSGNLADFSSRGPVLIDGSGRIKPDIAAPGVDILSAYPGGTYQVASGTSMAGPHVVGVVALMWSANPALIGDIDRTEQILIDTATPHPVGDGQGCFADGTPNNLYGYGEVNAYAAVKAAIEAK